jgi:hypothetical protein
MADNNGTADDAGIIDPTVEEQETKKGLRDEAHKGDRGHEAHRGDVAPPGSDVAGTPQSPLTGPPAKPQGHSDE